jgi:hypothetical protein
MKKLIVTPEGTFEVELTAEDIAQRQLDEQNYLVEKQNRIAKEEQEKSKKQSAIAKLKALGLDEEEVKAILGV